MGEYAELAIADEAAHYGEASRIAYWKCRDGRFVLIASMEVSHAANTVRMLQRKRMQHHPQYQALLNRSQEV